jgi:hypothetical protein
VNPRIPSSKLGLDAVAAASMLALGAPAAALAGPPHGGGFHGGGFHGGDFHGGGGYRGGGFHGGFHGGFYGGFHGGGFHGGGYGFHGGGFPYGFRHPGFFRPYGVVPFGLGFGLYLSTLPWYYSTFWWNGAPYYYANNDYYQWDADAGSYEQVQPPPQVVQQAGQPSAVPQLFAYPEKGQSPQQQATDKAECGQWASAQSGFSPGGAPPPATPGSSAATGNGATGSTAVAGAPADNLAAKQQDYLRAESACLKGRGYSVD